MSDYLRSFEDVQATAKMAGIPPSPHIVQVLHYGHNIESSDLKLVQLPPNVLDALTEGQRVVIRGEPQEHAVLCTDDRTYGIKVAETSNSLLLCPSLILPGDTEFKEPQNPVTSQEVRGCLFSMWELQRCQPRLEKLSRLLQQCPYGGVLAENEMLEMILRNGGEDQQHRTYSFGELLDLIQASEEELKEGIRSLNACEIDGKWRLLDLDYRDKVFQTILNLLEEKDWAWQSVPLQECCDILAELEPSFIIEHCLNMYGVRCTTADGLVVYELMEDKVCQFFAELLLRPAGRFNYREFMESWQQAVPMGMSTSLQQLKGIALTDMNSIPPVIWHYPVNDLPHDPSTRFAKLFRVRDKWSYDDLEPYIRPLESPALSLNALLLKYTRASTGPQGKKLYNLKPTAL